MHWEFYTNSDQQDPISNLNNSTLELLDQITFEVNTNNLKRISHEEDMCLSTLWPTSKGGLYQIFIFQEGIWLINSCLQRQILKPRGYPRRYIAYQLLITKNNNTGNTSNKNNNYKSILEQPNKNKKEFTKLYSQQNHIQDSTIQH